MGRFFRGVLLSVILLSPLAISSLASAEEFNHIITVYASVAEQRGLYVDKDSNLVKVAGNTSNNIQPLAFTMDNKPTAMTDFIMTQYQDFLKAHANHLVAGKTYLIAPKQVKVAVDNSSNQQSIQVNDTAPVQELTLTL